MPLAHISFDDGVTRTFPVLEREGKRWIVLNWLEVPAGKGLWPMRILLLETLPHEELNPGAYLLSGRLPSLLYLGGDPSQLGPQYVVQDLPDDPP